MIKTLAKGRKGLKVFVAKESFGMKWEETFNFKVIKIRKKLKV